MKLAILGGGGFRVPLVYRALLDDRLVDEVALYDSDGTRLQVVEAVLGQLAADHPRPPKVVTTTDLADALQGADFVFSAIRVGGLRGRTRDERVALDNGVLGQETTGPGGLAYALRTVPVARAIAEQVARIAPSAYVINFTNPAGIITEAMQDVLGERVVGICDTPSALAARLVALLGVDPARARADYVGLNHLGWLRALIVDGVDRLPELLASERLAETEEAQLFGVDWLRTLGAIPNEYLYYYYFNTDAVRKVSSEKSTRGEYLLAQQRDFYERAAGDLPDALALWRRTLADREATYMAEARDHRDRPELETSGGGYEEIALRVMTAIARDEPARMIVNVRNGSTVQGLPEDAVVEVPALVDGSGLRPFAVVQPDLHQRGLMEQVKAVERLTIEAAVTRSRELATLAFALHPLVGSVSTARSLADGYAAAHPELAWLSGG